MLGQIPLPLIFFLYAILAAAVIYATNRASRHIDQIDGKTHVSSALLGGILLAGVTSLPELITSLVSVVILQQPGLAFGNVFGSNLFNLLIIATMDLLFLKHFCLNKISRSNKETNLIVIVLYVIVLIPFVLNMLVFQGSSLFLITTYSFSAISVLILIGYGINAKRSGSHDETERLEKTTPSEKPLQHNIMMFVIFAILLVTLSILITFVTDHIATELQLAASFAGAIFLGVATSLPELTAVYTLFKLKNYDVAVGNIVGSNVFNLAILSFVDLVSHPNLFAVLYNGEDPSLRDNIAWLLILGLIGMAALHVASLRRKTTNKMLYAAPSLIIVASYIVYIIISNV